MIIITEKKLWNTGVMLTPTVIGALGTVTKGLERGLEDLEIKGQVETIQTTEYREESRRLAIT